MPKENRELNLPLDPVQIVILTEQGERHGRVMEGKAGMTFVVDSFTDREHHGGRVFHVRDYRYASDGWGAFCIWSLAPGDYQELRP